MKQHQTFTKKEYYWFEIIAFILITLGVFFRLANIEGKVYWHDEVYTSIRASGHLTEEIYQTIFNNKITSVDDLQKFQDIKPGSTALDTIKSLAQEDPQHPPFYFLLYRINLLFLEHSLFFSRILPIVFSFLSLITIYFFTLEIFNKKIVSVLAVILLALSPFDIIFSQINRQYSLLTLIIFLSSWLCWQFYKHQNRKNIIIYTIVATIGLYTHPFFTLILFGHGCFIFIEKYYNKNNRLSIIYFIGSWLTTIILYLPWFFVLITNYQRVIKSTNWAYHAHSPLYLFKLWIISYTLTFTDINFGSDNLVNYLYHFLFIILIFLSFYTLYYKADRSVFYFILILVLVPFLCLAIPDLIQSSYRSAISRYAMICYPAIQIAVAFYLVDKITYSRNWWQVLFALILTNSIISCALITFSDTNLAKSPSEFNGEIARKINTFNAPLVISDQGDEWTNIANIISLSYLVKKDTRFFLTSVPFKQQPLENIVKTTSSDILVFRPSTPLKTSLEAMSDRLEDIVPAGNLYQVLIPNPHQ